jgi:predicted ester cyclase/ketosteroid isomerase-like protein
MDFKQVAPFTMLTESEAKPIIEQWYRLFNRPDANEVRHIYDQVTTADYRSLSGDGTGESWERETSIRVVQSFATTIPDMQFIIRDVIVSGNQVAVRGEVSGTPALSLFSGRIPFSGKSFKVLTVDIHTISEGKIQKTYHLENWFAAAQQLHATGSENAVGTSTEVITEAEVREVFEQFIAALKTGNLSTLERLYADDYLLIRSSGEALSKTEILKDIEQHTIRLLSSSVKAVKFKICGSVGIMLAEFSMKFVSDGQESAEHGRQTAMFIKSKGGVRLANLQMTRVDA